MENDKVWAEKKKARHMMTYETATCRTRVRVCECACVHVWRVCARVTCVRVYVIKEKALC